MTKPKQPFHGQTRIGSATTVVLDSKKYLELCETCPYGGVMFGKSTRAGIAVALLVVAGTAAAEMYAVNVRRIDKDLYKTDTGLYIQTKYCYEYAYGDDAILRYEPYSYDNKLIFDNGATCDVEKVFK